MSNKYIISLELVSLADYIAVLIKEHIGSRSVINGHTVPVIATLALTQILTPSRRLATILGEAE